MAIRSDMQIFVSTNLVLNEMVIRDMRRKIEVHLKVIEQELAALQKKTASVDSEAANWIKWLDGR